MLDVFQTGLPSVVLWVIVGLAGVYVLATVWTHLSIGRLLWQNVAGANKVALPKLGRSGNVPSVGAGEGETTALVLARAPETIGPAERGGIIYPAEGRNGLHFTPAKCTGCALCLYVCPTDAIKRDPNIEGYVHKFDLSRCVFCGLCEAACPTQAIQLTVSMDTAANDRAALTIGGQVELEHCSKCGRDIPDEATLAGRIYDFDIFPDDDYKREKAVLVVQPEAACPECTKRIMAREDKVA